MRHVNVETSESPRPIGGEIDRQLVLCKKNVLFVKRRIDRSEVDGLGPLGILEIRGDRDACNCKKYAREEFVPKASFGARTCSIDTARRKAIRFSGLAATYVLNESKTRRL